MKIYANGELVVNRFRPVLLGATSFNINSVKFGTIHYDCALTTDEINFLLRNKLLATADHDDVSAHNDGTAAHITHSYTILISMLLATISCLIPKY